MIKSAADIRVILSNELPCYSLDGGDEFLFVAQARDIERVAWELWRNLCTRNGSDNE